MRGASMGSFNSRNPSQLEDMKKRFSVMHTDQIREKTSLPISSDDTSPVAGDIRDRPKILEPKLDIRSTPDYINEQEGISKDRPQHSPLNIYDM